VEYDCFNGSQKALVVPANFDTTGRRAVVLAYIILSIAAAKTSDEEFDICVIPLLIGSVIIVFLWEVSCDAVSICFSFH
jgi:hypothetical protein